MRDATDPLVKSTDPLGGEPLFSYNARLVQRTNPLGQPVSFTYDTRDNLLIRAAAGQVITNAYDARSRLTGRTTPDDTLQLTYSAFGDILTIRLMPPMCLDGWS